MIKSNAKKSSSSSSSSSYSKPFSWLTKLKQLKFNDSNHTKTKQIQTKNQIPFQPSCFEIGGRRTREQIKLKKKEIDQENQRKLVNEDNKSTSMEYDREKEYENIRRRFERKAQQVLEQQLLKIERESKEIEENFTIQFDSPRTICTPRSRSLASDAALKKNYVRLRNLKENAVSQKKYVLNKDNSIQKKHNNGEKIERRKPKKVSKVKIYSPRMISKVEMCRIKAMEEMRNKAKEKMIKEEISISTNKAELDDSFAVIKCSVNPKQDFRDSMIEMIEEKKISKAEEMEELLACYLTLNADEYHDLIIKVFKQVWFDMSHYGLRFKSLMH